MEACIENPGLVVGAATPSWAIRVARPVGDGYRMAEELRGVPVGALQRVFGRALGRRIWQQERADAGARPAASSGGRVSDAEIAFGMVGYLCEQAASTLRGRQRIASGVTLTASYADGGTKAAQGRLAKPTNLASDIDALARQLMDELPRDGVQSVNLKVSSIEVAVARERALASSISTVSPQPAQI
jgi:nucleotidyltransferase/DNA polymerase involved in DNA repair